MRFLNKKLMRNLLIIAGIFIVVLIRLWIFSNKGDGSANLDYIKIEQKLVDASKSYLKKTELYPQEQGDIITISSDVLISNKYMKSFDKLTKDTNCFGQVYIQRNGENYNYMPNLTCDNYQTNSFKNKITSLVREDGEDGVYLINNEYIYRGEKVNNYLKMGDNIWRIIKMTDDGYLKIIMQKYEENAYIWDNRYNVTTKDYSGINEYEKSRISETLYKLYSTKGNFGRLYIVPRYICVGKRAYNNFTLGTDEECSLKSEKVQYLDLINSTDLAYASLDQNCNHTNDMACNNYNYFTSFFRGSWSLISEKDKVTSVYFYNIGNRITYKANSEKRVYLVAYVNADNTIKSGNGTSSSPYLIN